MDESEDVATPPTDISLPAPRKAPAKPAKRQKKAKAAEVADVKTATAEEHTVEAQTGESTH